MTTRRSFLTIAGAGALLAASGETRLAGAAAAQRPTTATNAWDLSWVDRLAGKKHKAVFDSPSFSEGESVFRALLWMDQLKEIYGAAKSDIGAVLVVRHTAMPLVMNDEYWSRFQVGKRVKMKDPATGRWATKNPFMTTPPGTPPQFADYNTPTFMANGGTILACNIALQQAVRNFATADKLSHDAAQERAQQHLLPGVILQPSGVFAALTAQEAGCSYILAS
ncbi:MAG TPA: hypothetical protein VFE05_19725 [Longimicrobiaceae bacterium]|jgi:hypothetical protein|nr:hypothetical protein [Longimicrobiaceae bacterium]